MMKKALTNQVEKQVIYDPYISSIINMKIYVPIADVGKNIKQNLEKLVVSKTEGKCIVDGFVRPDSVKIITYSSGKVSFGLVEFQVAFECMVCHPVDGMLVECICKTITKAGIHAEVVDKMGNIPITIFIARDHHINNHKFLSVMEKSKMKVSILGVRFELHDSNICAIGRLVELDKEI